MSCLRSGARETVDDTLMDSKMGQSAIFRPSVVYNQSTHYSMAGRDRKIWRSSVSSLTHSVLFPFSPRVPNKYSSIRNKHFRSDKRICQPGRAGREKRGSEEGRKKNQRDQKSGRLFPFVDFSTWRERERQEDGVHFIVLPRLPREFLSKCSTSQRNSASRRPHRTTTEGK